MLDTNVIVSAVAFRGGPPSVLYELGLQRRIALVTTQPLLAELERILTQKIGWARADVQRLLRQVSRRADVVAVTEAVTDFAVDPADNRVLEAALAGHADLIGSSDRALRAIGEWRGIPLCTVGEAIELLTEPAE